MQVFIAQLLLAGEGDTIFALQSLVGAVGMTAFTYFLPLLFFNLLLGDRISWNRRCWHGINFIAGVRALWLFPLRVFYDQANLLVFLTILRSLMQIVIMIGGLYYSMSDLLTSAGGVFNGVCLLKYSYSPENPDDPCHEDT